MIETLRSWSGVIALVILAIVFVSGMVGHKNAFGSTACGSITCLEGGLRLISDVGGDFESDVAAVINSTLHVTGAVTMDAAATVGTTLAVTGATTLSATTTAANVNITTTNSATSTAIFGCWQMYATSTATAMHVIPVASATTTTSFGSETSGYVLMAAFGKCPRI